jgi:hypothetical protein
MDTNFQEKLEKRMVSYDEIYLIASIADKATAFQLTELMASIEDNGHLPINIVKVAILGMANFKKNSRQVSLAEFVAEYENEERSSLEGIFCAFRLAQTWRDVYKAFRFARDIVTPKIAIELVHNFEQIVMSSIDSGSFELLKENSKLIQEAAMTSDLLKMEIDILNNAIISRWEDDDPKKQKIDEMFKKIKQLHETKLASMKETSKETSK